MRTIQTFCKVLSITTVLSLALGSTHAQESLPWPKTFVGQPDFDFLREDVINEYKRKKGENADIYIATLQDLLATKEIDPFVPKPLSSDIGRSKYSKDVFEQRFGLNKSNRKFRDVYPDVEVGSGIEIRLAGGQIAQAELINDTQAKLLGDNRRINIEVDEKGLVVEAHREQSISESFEGLIGENQYISTGDLKRENPENSDIAGLPEYYISVKDLPNMENASEEQRQGLEAFASFLENIITQATKAMNADMDEIDMDNELAQLSIQSIVTSPNTYTIINNKRYNVGDRLPINITYKQQNTDEIEKLIDSYMPNKEAISEDTYKQYKMLKDEAIKQFEERTGQDQVSKDSKKQIVHATIREILSRKVVIEMLNKEYTLDIKLAL